VSVFLLLEIVWIIIAGFLFTSVIANLVNKKRVIKLLLSDEKTARLINYHSQITKSSLWSLIKINYYYSWQINTDTGKLLIPTVIDQKTGFLSLAHEIGHFLEREKLIQNCLVKVKQQRCLIDELIAWTAAHHLLCYLNIPFDKEKLWEHAMPLAMEGIVCPLYLQYGLCPGNKNDYKIEVMIGENTETISFCMDGLALRSELKKVKDRD
jgi:hypothetical protein